MPPGAGKTLYSIQDSLAVASRGTTVLFALPTHSSALTALAYAINAFYELYKSPGQKRLPYIIYYEGVNRFCPLYRYKKVYEKAVEHAKKRMWIDADEYARLINLSPDDVMRIFGWDVVCRKLCPVYRNPPTFGKTRIFVPRAFAEIEKRVLQGEARVYVKNAVKNLSELEKDGLVYRLGVYMDFNQRKFSGCCVRILLSRGVIRGKRISKVTVYTRGALIITPTSGVEYLLKFVVARINNMNKRKANVPTPLVVLDEYDTYFYRPATIPMFTVEWIVYEKKLAEELVSVFEREYLSGRPVDVDVATAAALAYVLLDALLLEVRDTLDNNKVRKTLGVAAMVLEAAAAQVRDQENKKLVVEPLRPRPLYLHPIERFVEIAYTRLESFVETRKLFFINPRSVLGGGIWYYLSLWEYVMEAESRRRGVPYKAPALVYWFSGNVLRTGYLRTFSVYRSAAKWLFLIRKKGIPNPTKKNMIVFNVAYRASYARGKFCYYDSERDGERCTETWGFLISMVSYDTRFHHLVEHEARYFLTSATGLPWGSAFYKTRWAVAKGIDSITTSIISYLELYKYPVTVFKKDRMEFVMEPRVQDPLKKKIVVVSPRFEFLVKYSEHGKIRSETAGYLPSRRVAQRNPMLLKMKLSSYISDLVFIMAKLWAKTHKIPFNPAVMVLAQRKDVAVEVTLTLHRIAMPLSKGKASVSVCTEVECTEVKASRKDLEEALAKLRPSHILVKARDEKFAKDLKIYVTWFRSRLCRGVDIPDEDVVYAVVVVGSPLRPPSIIDRVYEENPFDMYEMYSVAGRLEIRFKVYNTFLGEEYSTPLCVAHIPIDASESVNELIQAYGRALRRAWRAREVYNYVTLLRIPLWLENKFMMYSQLWMKEIIKQDILRGLSSGKGDRERGQGQGGGSLK